jgi:restriction system protein
MPIPKVPTMMLPLLQFASDGREHSMDEAVDGVADIFKLTDQERNQLYSSGKGPVFADRVAWARTYLKQAALVEYTRRSHFQITERGIAMLAEKPTEITEKMLERFPEWLDFLERSRKKTTDANKPKTREAVAAESQTPKEAISQRIREVREVLAQELLDTIKAKSPAFFENLVVKLLVGMGYGGSIQDAGQAIGQSGDGGIDGIIKEDKLGLDVIYIQAKRWGGTVGRPEIQRFAGALQMQHAKKGVFITTSAFTSDARSYTEGIESKIVLIDGEQLAQLMIDHNVGVAIDEVYELKRIDSDYFSGE